MVYGYLPISTTTKTVEVIMGEKIRGLVFLTSTKFQVAILATCKLVKEESEPIISMSMEKSPAPAFTYSCDFVDQRYIQTIRPVAITFPVLRAYKMCLMPDLVGAREAEDKSPFTLSDGMVSNSNLQSAFQSFRKTRCFAQDQIAEVFSFVMCSVQHARKTGHHLHVRLHGLSPCNSPSFLRQVNRRFAKLFTEATIELSDTLPTALIPYMVQNVEGSRRDQRER